MRIMAFDYGTKRIGIAVTDSLQIIATALATVHPEKIFEFVADYLIQEKVETFVVGKPLQLDGSESESATHVKGFVRKLKRTFPEINLVEIDERFTSKMASNVIASSGAKKKKRQDKATIDTVAATILLQDYLQSKSILG